MSTAAIGAISTATVRMVRATSEPTWRRSPACAMRLRAGSIAVTIDTVMTLCGSMKMRCAFWYVVRPAATASVALALTFAWVASRVMNT